MSCVAEMVKQNYSTDQLIRDLKANYYTKYFKFSDKLFRLKEIFRSLDVSKIGRISLMDAKYAVRSITGFEITTEVLNSVQFCQLNGQYCEISENNYDMLLNFEQFYWLIAIYDCELEKLNIKRTKGHLKLNSSFKSVLTNSQSSNVSGVKPSSIKPIQKVIDWFSSVTHHPNRHQSDRQSLHLKSDNNINNVIRRSNSINRINKLNNGQYYNVSSVDGSNYITIHSSGSLQTNNHQLNSSGEDEVDFICNSVKNDVLNKRIQPKSVYPFAVECRDIYLGGTCGSKWRENIAIPLLRKQAMTYYYQYENFYEENINPFEASAILNSRVLLFVITNNSRSLSSMLMAAHCIAKGYRVVMCIQHIAEGEIIKGEKISEIARKDYNRGRDYLIDMVKRYDQEIFHDIAQATTYAANLSKALRKSKTSQ